MNREKYRRFLIVVFAVYLCAFIYYLSYTIYTFASNESLAVAQINGENNDKKLMPLGMPVGIYIRARGVMVLDTGEVTTINGKKAEPTKDCLEKGDYLLELNGEEIESIDWFTEAIYENGNKELTLTVLRDGTESDIKITPVQTGMDEYKIGVWIRQDAQGIGTLTYVDEQGNFAALGHGIADVDTSEIIDIQSGSLYESTILSIVKGKSGEPGEMVGHIDYQNSLILGKIVENSEQGIYGILKEEVELYDENQALPIGGKDEIKEGPAVIRCCINGQVKDYDIVIESVDKISLVEHRNLIIEITDKELLSETNGIIQGMSGSPIIQDGKIVGAVTHVLVDDPTRGYGIFIENMLQTER